MPTNPAGTEQFSCGNGSLAFFLFLLVASPLTGVESFLGFALTGIVASMRRPLLFRGEAIRAAGAASFLRPSVAWSVDTRICSGVNCQSGEQLPGR